MKYEILTLNGIKRVIHIKIMTGFINAKKTMSLKHKINTKYKILSVGMNIELSGGYTDKIVKIDNLCNWITKYRIVIKYYKKNRTEGMDNDNRK